MQEATSDFAPGSLVRARGREWVVLPESTPPLLILRPLGGADEEVAGIHTGIESVEPATFSLPDINRPGDFRSSRLLRDAVRLGFRASAGPFRSFGRIGIEPRPYQFVPLLMALRQDPVRLLIADDVGIGKTIEALLIAREFYDRGEIKGFTVLCPPHLAEQWHRAMVQQFHLPAELVLSHTAAKLERRCAAYQSIFDVYPITVVSLDFIKSDRRREDFLRAAPEMVIVDEAHTCAWGGSARAVRQKRYALLEKLAKKEERHLVLVTAVPHSGKEEEFRSLLTLLEPDLANLPADLSGENNRPHRERLAKYYVQRRRRDIEHYLNEDTPFPNRISSEETYRLTPEYKRFFDRALDWAKEKVADVSGTKFQQRVRWWSAIALLRSIASSPAAAADTLRKRAAVADAEDVEAADEVGQALAFDPSEDEADTLDATMGVLVDANTENISDDQKELLEMATEAEELFGKKDAKLAGVIKIVKQLLEQGHSPIVFCRYIPTAAYLSEGLRKALKTKVPIIDVTGQLPPSEREKRIGDLGEGNQKVLVATDCLSEGVNLQAFFDAVVHYDLAWNPARHEQREGRVDRYGQRQSEVRLVTYFGTDNGIDGMVLDVLLRKHTLIRKALGVSVPIPADETRFMEAVMKGLLLRKKNTDKPAQGSLFGDEDQVELHRRWDQSADREKASRNVFAQHTIRTDEVARELNAVREALGNREELERFVRESVTANGGIVKDGNNLELDLTHAPRALRDRLNGGTSLRVCFKDPAPKNTIILSRTHPWVEAMAGFMLDGALDSVIETPARRCSVIRTDAVETRTTLVLARFRFHIHSRTPTHKHTMLAEDLGLIAFEGKASAGKWLDRGIPSLMSAEPKGNVASEQAKQYLQMVVEATEILALRGQLDRLSDEFAGKLAESHKRVRIESRRTSIQYSVEPQLPVDVLGIFVYLPL